MMEEEEVLSLLRKTSLSAFASRRPVPLHLHKKKNGKQDDKRTFSYEKSESCSVVSPSEIEGKRSKRI